MRITGGHRVAPTGMHGPPRLSLFAVSIGTPNLLNLLNLLKSTRTTARYRPQPSFAGPCSPSRNPASVAGDCGLSDPVAPGSSPVHPAFYTSNFNILYQSRSSVAAPWPPV